MRRARGIVASVAALVVLVALSGVGLAGVGAPAAAATSTTTIAFSDEQVVAPFASTWTAQIQVEAEGFLVTEGDGRVDISIDGIAGVWASLDLTVGGYAFLSQPLDQPLLPAGDYAVRALFIPSGTGLGPATSAPLSLSITPLTATATVSTEITGETLTFSGELAGGYLEATGLAPAGIWEASLSGPDSDTPVETLRIAQDATAPGPISAAFATPLSLGTTYTIEWEFTALPELAGGLDLTASGTETAETRAPTVIDALIAPVPWPLAAWIVTGAILLLLTGAVIALAVIARRRRAAASATEPSDEPSVDPPAMIEA